MKKGFTLIELLAVIVVLAIIALIVVPIIISIINESKKASFKTSVEQIKNSAKIYYADKQLTGEVKEDKLLLVNCTDKECKSDIEYKEKNELSQKLEIKNPKKGNLLIKKDKILFGYFISDDNTYIGIINNDKVEVYDYNNQQIEINDGILVISNGVIAGQIPYNFGIVVVQDMDLTIAQPTPVECFNFDSSTGTITKYYKNRNDDISQELCPDDAVIPSKINEVDVKAIGRDAFYGKSLNSVVLPEGIETIKSQAFYANKFTKVVIPTTVKTIESRAFSSNKIESIIFLGTKAIDISSSAFENNNLTGEDAFLYKHTDNGIDYSYLVAYYTNEKDITIPQYKNGVQLKTIGSDAFYGKSLNSVVLPEGIETIKSQAFYGNKFTKIVIPSTVRIIGSNSFASNKIDSLIFLGTKAIDISANAFNNNNFKDEDAFLYKHTNEGIDYSYLVAYYTNEKDITIPQYKNGVQLKTIGSDAFYGKSLNSIILPEGVETIDSQAFYGNKFTKIVIPSSVNKMGQSVLGNNSNLTIIVNKTGKTFNWKSYTGKGTKGISDDGVETTTFVTGKLLDASGNVALTVTDTE